MTRRIPLLLATLLTVLGLTVAGTLPAQAWENAYLPGVGSIQGIYETAPQQDYRGYLRSDSFGNCAWVERRNGVGDWNHTGISGYNNCYESAQAWSLNDNTLVANTYAIRLRRGSNWIYLCNGKSVCLAMR